MRKLGISADYVIEADIVDASGNTLHASSSTNPDLFWAIRGGGGSTFGIVTQFTLRLVQLPRSSMVYISWSDTNDRYPVAKRFLEWAPTAPSAFTSQINVYKTNVTVLGWYLGASLADAQRLVKESGLGAIGKPMVQVSGNCNTDNSRLFGYTTFECVPDDQVDSSLLNVIQDPFEPIPPNSHFQYKEEPKSSTRETAPPWGRFRRLSKSFFVQKNKVLTDANLKEVVARIGELDAESEIWGEWHAWNISSDKGRTSDNAFAWREEAMAHLEFQVHGSADEKKQKVYQDWFGQLERLLRPALGPASYSGYADASISVQHLVSYYGKNVCRLIEIKRRYDPTNFFTTPQAIPPVPPAGVAC